MAQSPEDQSPESDAQALEALVDADVLALEAFIEAVPDFCAFDPVKPGAQFQITLKKPVRDALRFGGRTQLYLYGTPRLGVALLVAEPLSARDEFIARVREGLRKARTQSTPPDVAQRDAPSSDHSDDEDADDPPATGSRDRPS